jgi:hypothetical protein
VIIINIVFSVHFIAITLAGVIFYLTQLCFKEKLYYSLLSVILAFLVIETTQGLKPFSLFLISFVLYSIILPLARRLFSFDSIRIFVEVFIFYIFVLLIYYISTGELFLNFWFIVINICIDILILGILL